MSEHRPTVVNDPDQDGEALDSDLLPDEFPDDRPLASRDYGTTEAEQGRRESLGGRLRREEPDVVMVEDSDDDSDDDADDDSPDILSGDDEEADPSNTMVSIRGGRDRHADDSGQLRSSRSAEEDAIHLVDRDRDLDAVEIALLSAADIDDVVAGAQASRDLHHPWVEAPQDADAVRALLDRPADRFLSYAIRCDDGLVGLINANEIVRGRFCSAYLGYYAFEGFAGRGLMRAGMRLVLAELFGEVGLHRVEANVRPENTRSVRFVEHLGFSREGYSRGYLHLDGDWRDHERWALLCSDPH